MFAKNRNAAAGLTARLQRQGEGGSLHKRYFAVLCGKPSENEGRFVDYLYKDENNKAVIIEDAGASGKTNALKDAGASEKADNRKDVGASGKADVPKDAAASGAKQAVLSYRILQAIDSPAELALAEISLETGRFHQIRAQMAYHGYPLLGDVKYGDDRSKSLSQRLCVKNVALCACHLEFVHPVTKKDMSFRTEPRGQAFSCFDYFN